jgi:hypothetical protein
MTKLSTGEISTMLGTQRKTGGFLRPPASNIFHILFFIPSN